MLRKRGKNGSGSLFRRGLRGGRLVAFLPEQTIGDGGSTLESRCYFDWFDTPPWDAWVWLGERVPDKTWGSDCYLLAWVPSSRIEDVDGGIEFCPSDCLHWATNIELPVTFMLRDLGLA